MLATTYRLDGYDAEVRDANTVDVTGRNGQVYTVVHGICGCTFSRKRRSGLCPHRIVADAAVHELCRQAAS